MAEIKIAGVMRAGAFSPNHIGNDAAIFNLVAEQLRKRGCEVNIYSEEQFAARSVSEPVVLNMCRGARSIELLQQLEDSGVLVINSGYGIENCTRQRMARILLGSNIPYPDSLIVNTDEGVRDALRRAGIERCWIKRGEGHTMHREDVCFVRHAEEAQEILQEFFMRGIKRAVINRHLEGDLVKFYGIAGTNFFYWFYPLMPTAKSDAEEPSHPSFSGEKLRAVCQKAAEAVDVKIYGGDCIVAPDGSFKLIDFNDWPSFAPCRVAAAPHIARFVMKEIKQHIKA